MKKEWKNALQEIYEAPRPERKWKFLRSLEGSLEEPELSLLGFLWQQILYIRKGNWILAAALLLAAVLTGRWARPQVLWAVSACIPYLALSTVAEGSRSVRYGMEELELSARFSLKMVVTARLGILGLGNLALLCCMSWPLYKLIPVLPGRRLLFLGMSILLPYLLTTFLNLWAVQRFRGKEGLFVCAGLTCVISACFLLLGSMESLIYETIRAGSCLGILALLAVLSGREYRKFIRQAEEYGWNFGSIV